MRDQWWDSEKIIRHHNYKICGEYLPGIMDGLNKVILTEFAGRLPFKNSLSVGCGNGKKEIELNRLNITDSMILVDIIPRWNIENSLPENYYFSSCDYRKFGKSVFDMIYWNASLHHMESTKEAIEISYDLLKPGGVFIAYEYVGPNRFQWLLKTIRGCNILREKIGEPPLERPDILKVTHKDPNEAADSENIVKHFSQSKFKNKKLIESGGAIYHPCFGGILDKVDEDDPIMDEMLEMDDFLLGRGFNHHAVLIGVKE